MTAGETEPARGAGTDTRQLGSVWALLGAVSGVVVGVLLQEPTPEAFRPALEAIELGGQLWLRTLRAIVLPLLVGSLITVVAGTLKGDAPRGHASRTLCVFAGLLVASLMLGAFAGTVTTATFPVDAARRAELAAAMRGFEIPASSAEAGAEVPWLVRLVPANPFEAAAEGELISLLFFAVMFGLALRRVRPDHAEPVLRFFQATASASTVPGHVDVLSPIACHPELWSYMPFSVSSDEEMAALVAWGRRLYASGTGLTFAIYDTESGDAVGSSSYLNASPENRRVEIGATWYTPRWQRTHVNTACKYLMLQHAFEVWDCVRVEFKTHHANRASQVAIERVGGVPEGVFRQHMIMPDGSLRDSFYYSILDSEWPQVKRLIESSIARPAR